MPALEVDPNLDVDIGDAEGGWADDDEDIDPLEDTKKRTESASGDGEGGWDVEDADLEIPDLGPSQPSTQGDAYIHLPTQGPSQSAIWTKNSELPADHVMAGSFESAARLLNSQIGVVNFLPYRKCFLDMFGSSRTVSSWQQHIPPNFSYPQRSGKDVGAKGQLPVVSIKLSDLVQNLQVCYQLTTGGKFTEAIEKMQALMLQVTLLVVDTKQEISEAQQLLKICREYVVGLKMETLRKTLPKTTAEEQERQCEMAAYFTHCNLQPIHQILTLRTALNMFFKLKNYKTASSFAKRLLDLGPRAEVSQQARKILQACESNPTDEFKLGYDEHNPFNLCAYSYKPIYRGKPEEKCPLCGASYIPQYKGNVCNVCEVAEIGMDCIGLRISYHQFR